MTFSHALHEALSHYELDEAQVSEKGGTLNACSTSLAKARAYAETTFKKVGKDLDEVIPDFDENLKKLQGKCKRALNVPRVQMPVIEPTDMKGFTRDLNKGKVDLFKPWAKGKLYMPGYKLPRSEGPEWLELGVKDGDPKDDVIKAKWTKVPASKLIPTQSQIWLEKLINNIAKWGVPSQGSPIAKATIIVSREGYILDGHHRFGQAILAAPKLKMEAIVVPLKIKQLLQMGTTYGAALGHRPKA
jgi:hypothetical protein